ncbi:MAG: hypothetical protein V1767_04900 [Chloroflexota bacterium]
MSKRRLILPALVLLLVFTTTFFTLGCEPGDRLVIDNQRNHEVRIDVTRVRSDGTLDNQVRNYGLIPTKSTKELGSITFTNMKNIFRVEAIDPLGKAVFSHDYNYYDLEKIQWKITIPP